MEFINQFGKTVLEEMKKLLGEVEGINWDNVYLHSGEINFNDYELNATFWHENYSNRYSFYYDYEYQLGGLYHDSEEGTTEVKGLGNINK